MYRFAIIASEYNSVIMDRLIAGARRALKDQKQVSVFRVPGSFEIPLASRQAALSKKYDGVVALGCVLRGETPHFEYISRAVSDGLQRVALETGVPIGFGGLDEPPAVSDFARLLVTRTVEHVEQIDELIKRHAEHWRLDRMATVDRNLLRLATQEFLLDKETPKTVVINEAIEIARRFSA